MRWATFEEIIYADGDWPLGPLRRPKGESEGDLGVEGRWDLMGADRRGRKGVVESECRQRRDRLRWISRGVSTQVQRCSPNHSCPSLSPLYDATPASLRVH